MRCCRAADEWDDLLAASADGSLAEELTELDSFVSELSKLPPRRAEDPEALRAARGELHRRPLQLQPHVRPLSRRPTVSDPPGRASTSVIVTPSPRPTIYSNARVGSTAAGILPNRGYKHLRFWGIPPYRSVILTGLLHAQAMLLCLSSGDFGEVLLVALGEAAVVSVAEFEGGDVAGGDRRGLRLRR